jgi:hypothetical protein
LLHTQRGALGLDPPIVHIATGSQYAVTPFGRDKAATVAFEKICVGRNNVVFPPAFGTKRARKGRVAVCCKTSRPALTCCRKSVISPRTPSNCVDAELGMHSTRLQRSVGNLHAQQPSPWSGSSYILLMKAAPETQQEKHQHSYHPP